MERARIRLRALRRPQLSTDSANAGSANLHKLSATSDSHAVRFERACAVPGVRERRMRVPFGRQAVTFFKFIEVAEPSEGFNTSTLRKLCS